MYGREMDYNRCTIIRGMKIPIRIIVRTTGLLVSRIFVDCYDPLPNCAPNSNGDYPFYVTEWYIDTDSPIRRQSFVYYTPKTGISDTMVLARMQHKRIVAMCKVFLRKRGKQWKRIDDGGMFQEISVFPSITSNIRLGEKSFSRFL